ncbi:hypothetical protein Nepgr_022148 [Nepenthes gracilis]|uniref:Rad60/SUMO-like domain-containing protein n=1 Tax=Nepenthes gracilis TaxID=150966 RepID=A0AAD3XWJ1_NEPGR|nr:hypothetical protein Nepgr_022148 [Nepenthes gracilis]
MADDLTVELEPLFDYSRVQPNIVYLDDDSDSSPENSPIRRRISKPDDEKGDKRAEKVVQVINCEENDYEVDWFLSPAKELGDLKNREEDSAIKELRLKKEELASLAQSAKDVFQALEESAKKEVSLLQSSLEQNADGDKVADQPQEPLCDRSKIVVSVQDKDGRKQFRVFVDDTFERFFKMYADKVKLDPESLVFCFDGEKISPMSTPTSEIARRVRLLHHVDQEGKDGR